jgi:SAM-dependent methyltransferase
MIENGQVVDRHLGGYVPGGDPATYYPELWDWLVTHLGVKSVVDVGCGDGVAVRHFQKMLGGKVYGVDGIPQQGQRNILVHDFTAGPFVPYWKNFDLCWSCEFVEHIEEKFIPNFLETFKCARYVLMTHAAPGQQGHHHVNCREVEYWLGAMAATGYRLDQRLTQQTRELAAQNTNHWNHFVRSGMAFVRATE